MPKQRSHGDGGLYELKGRKLWRGVIDVGFTPEGRRIQKSVTARTKTEARAKLDTLKKEIAEYGAPLDKTMTVAAWADKWLDTVCRPNMKPRPYSSYQSTVRSWIVPTIGRKRVSQLKPSDVRAVTQAIIAAGRAPATALKAHNVMSSMLESARLDGIIGRNVAKDVKAPSAVGRGRMALSTVDSIQLLKTASKHADGTRWWMAILTGMRQGERIGATIDSIDFENHEFTVWWSLTEATFAHGCGGECGKKRGGSCPSRKLDLADDLIYEELDGRLILVRPKSGRPRTFPLIPELEVALRRYLEATADVPNPHGLIWRNQDGSPITANQDSDAWRALLLEAGLISIEQAKPRGERRLGTPDTPTTHWARHTTATVLMELGVDAKIIGEIVGHMSERTTRGYQHVSSAAAREALTQMGHHFADAIAA